MTASLHGDQIRQIVQHHLGPTEVGSDVQTELTRDIGVLFSTSYPDRILRRPEVEQMTGLSRSEIYRRIALGVFPKARKLGSNAVGWLLSEIQAYIAGLEVAA